MDPLYADFYIAGKSTECRGIAIKPVPEGKGPDVNEKDPNGIVRGVPAMRWALAASVAALTAGASRPLSRAAAPSAVAVVVGAGDVSPDALTREAVAAASDIKNPQQRAQCLLRIADPLVAAGRPADADPILTAALDAIDAVKPADNDQLNVKFGLFARVAEMRARLGEIGAAREAGRRVHPEQMTGFGPDPRWWTGMVGTAIAAAQARSGNLPDALRTTDSIESTHWRGEALGAVAVAMEKSGDLPNAQKTADRIEQTFVRSKVLVEVAKLESRAGRAEAARRLLVAAAEPSDEGDQQDRAVAMQLVCEALAELGDRHKAIKLAERIAPFAQVDAQFSGRGYICTREGATAQIAALAGDAEAAIGALNSLPEARRVGMLDGIASAMARSGNAAGVRRVIEVAPAARRADLLPHLVEAQAASGDFPAAAQTAGEIENPVRHLLALTKVAAGQGAAGKVAAAQALLDRALDDWGRLPVDPAEGTSEPRLAALAAAAEAQGRLGQPDRALAWIRKEPSPAVRVAALSRLLAGTLGVREHVEVGA